MVTAQDELDVEELTKPQKCEGHYLTTFQAWSNETHVAKCGAVGALKVEGKWLCSRCILAMLFRAMTTIDKLGRVRS